MRHKNCHARSKQKRKKLRLKNFWAKVFAKRKDKIKKSHEPKGTTMMGEAKKFARPLPNTLPTGDRIRWGFLMDHSHAKNLNQRQKRKLRRQQPHGK